MEETKKSKKGLLVGIVLLLVFAGAYTFVLLAYQSEGETRKAELSYDADKLEKLDKNRIAADAKIVTADPMKGDIAIRLVFAPQGSLATADGKLARDLVLDVSAATGKHVYEYKKGRKMDPVEVIVDMYDGEPMDFPFDKHEGQLAFFFEPAGAAQAAEATAEQIPVALELRGSVSGLRIDASYAEENKDNNVAVVFPFRGRARRCSFHSLSWWQCGRWPSASFAWSFAFLPGTARSRSRCSPFSARCFLLSRHCATASPALRPLAR